MHTMRLHATAGLVALLFAAPVMAASKVQGRLLSDGLTGRTAPPKGWIDQKIYVGQLNVGSGGAGVNTYSSPPGWYSVAGPGGGTYPAGTYALFSLNFDAAVAFSINPNLVLPGGSVVVDPVHLNCPAHYSVMYDAAWTEWAAEPWIWGSDFYQTFTATSGHITRIATKLAGKSGDHQRLYLNHAIYQTNAGPPSGWTQIGATKTVLYSEGTDPIIHIFHVPYRSSDMNLITGNTYAVRFWRGAGSGSSTFALVARPDTGNGYANGHLWVGNTPRTDLDAYAYVSGGQPGTVVNHAPVGDLAFNTLVGSSNRYGQTFVASGSQLAGADIVYATGDPTPPSLPITFQCYDSVGGNALGPAKTCYGIPGFYQGRAAVAWSEGQVPLVTGNTYYLEWTSPGFNTWKTNENLPGQAYINRVAQPGIDLMMSIAEYDGPPPAPPVADFSATPLIGAIPLTVEFTDLSTGLVVERDWTFGDGGTATTANPVHQYTVPGTYTVSLTVANGGGTDTETRTGYIVVRKRVGDFDHDNDVDITDFAHMQLCQTGSGIDSVSPDCLDAKLDGDGDVDGADVAIMRGCMSGEGVPFNPGCRP